MAKESPQLPRRWPWVYSPGCPQGPWPIAPLPPASWLPHSPRRPSSWQCSVPSHQQEGTRPSRPIATQGRSPQTWFLGAPPPTPGSPWTSGAVHSPGAFRAKEWPHSVSSPAPAALHLSWGLSMCGGVGSDQRDSETLSFLPWAGTDSLNSREVPEECGREAGGAMPRARRPRQPVPGRGA